MAEIKTPEVNPAASQAQVFAHNDAVRDKTPLSPVDSYPFDNRWVVGTEQNQQILNLSNSNPNTSWISEDGSKALDYRTKFNEQTLKWQQSYDALNSKLSQAQGFVDDPRALSGMDKQLKDLEANRPQMHPYASWLLNLGDSPNQITTNITKNRDKAMFYFYKYQRLGIGKLLADNEKSVNDPESLAFLMESNGYFDNNSDEKDFFLKNATNRYSNFFGHSTFEMLNSKYSREFDKAGLNISTLPQQLQAGRPFDAKSEDTKKEFLAYWDWSRNNVKGQNAISNAFDGASHVAESFVQTMCEAAKTIDPSLKGNTEFEFSDEWNNATGENKELKDKFLYQWKNLKDFYAQGRGDNRFLFRRYAKFQESKNGKSPIDQRPTMDDPTFAERIPEEVRQLADTYRKIQAKNGFKYDAPGFAQAMSFIDGACQMTAGWGSMLASTDPDSTLSAFVGKKNSSLFAEKKPRMLPFSKKQLDISDEELEARINYFKNSVGFEKSMEDWKESGMFPSWAYDHDMAKSAAGWADLSLLYGIGKAGFKSVLGDSLDMVAKRNFITGVKAEYKAMSVNAEALVEKGISMPPELKTAVETVKNNNKAAGIPISDADAIKRIYAGEPVVLDPKTGQLAPFSKEALFDIQKKVADKLNTHTAVREELARLAVSSRRIEYTSKTMDTMKSIKEWLVANEKKSGINWNNVSNSDIYHHVRMQNIDIPNNVVSSQAIRNMQEEVGSVFSKFDREELAGYARDGSLPIAFAYDAREFIYKGTSLSPINLLKKAGKMADRYYDIQRIYGPGNEAAASVTVRTLNRETAQAGVGVAQSPTFRMWAMGHALPKIGQALGFIGDQLDYYQQYCKYEAKIGGTDMYGSALKTMKADAKAEYLSLVDKIDEAKANPAFKTEEDIQKLIERKKDALKRYMWTDKADVLFGEGLAKGTFGILKNGMIHGLYNEALAQISDSRNPGSMFGATIGFTGINRLTGGAMMLRASDSGTIERRTNYSLNELTGHLSRLSDDNQKRAFIEAVMDTAEKSYEVGLTKSPEIGKRFFAANIEAMNTFFRSGVDIRLGDNGTIEGVHAILSSRALADHPELAKGLKDSFLDEASKLGIVGDEAKAFAEGKVNAVLASVAANQRRGELGQQIDGLKTSISMLEEDANKHQASVEHAARLVERELGLNPDRITVDPIGDDTKVTIDGKEVPNDGTMPIRSRIISKINALREEKANLAKRHAETLASIDNLNNTKHALENELLALGQVSPIHEFRMGETVEDSSQRLTSYKDGITIWEKKDDKGNVVKTSVILDRNKLSLETMWEEAMHALMHTENAHKGVVMLNSAFFGSWEIDPNDKSKVIQQRTDPNTGVSYPTEPLISGDINTNIDLLRQFASSYADGLNTGERAQFMAQFEIGIKRFKSNPMDLAGLQPVMNELMAKIYIGRKATTGPFSSRGDWSKSSSRGSLELGPNVAGVSTGRLWLKLLHGELTVDDIALDGRKLNIEELGLGQDEKATPEQDLLKRRIIAAGRLIKLFGKGGDYDRTMQSLNVARAKQMGFDPKFFGTNKMYDTNGKIIDIPNEFQAIGNVVINETRGWGSEIRVDDIFNDDAVIDKSDSTDPKDVATRVKWALSSGRQSWINKAGQFKRPVMELMELENQPLREFFRHVSTDIDKKGYFYGLSLKRIGQGGYALVGTPNLEQSKNIKAFFDQYQGKDQYNYATWYNLHKIISSISEGNIFDPEAPSGGRLRVFQGQYRHVWQSAVGENGTRKYEKGDTRDMTFVPFSMMIMDTTLDAFGETNEEVKKVRGKEVSRKVVTGPQVYVWGFDVNNFEYRREAAMKGWPIDGHQWFEKGEIMAMFGNYDNYREATKAIMLNYAGKGSLDENSKEYQEPGARSWEAVLSLANGNKNKAKLWADAINRIIGFPTNNFQELTLLEREVMSKSSNGVALSSAELAQKRAQLKELRAKNIKEQDPNQVARAKLGAKVGRNQFEGSPDYNHAESTFMLVRPDRFVGGLEQMVDGNGVPVTMAMSNWGNMMGGINYSTENWNPLTEQGLKETMSKFDTNNAVVYQGWTHRSGYKTFLMQNRDEKGQLSKKSYVVFDPQNNLVNKGVFLKDLNQAFQVAAQHADDSPQIPLDSNNREMSLMNQGWAPKGIDMISGIRSKWMSGDGEWMLRRAETGGGYDVVHVKSGFTVAKKVNIFSATEKEQVNLGNVNAAIQEAVENNTIHVLTRNAEHRQLDEQGLAEWHLVPTINEQGTLGKNKKALYATDNPAYYDFKRMLAYGVEGKNGWGLAYAKKVTDIMKSELGAETVATNREAVMDWIDKWSNAWDDKNGLHQIAVDFVEQINFDDMVANEQYAQWLKDNHGVPVEFGRPEKPNEKDYTPHGGTLDEIAFNKAKARYVREMLAYDADVRRRKGVTSEQIQTTGIEDILHGIKIMKAELARDLAQRRVGEAPTLKNFEAEDVISNLGKTQRSMLEAKESARSIWLNNKAGYIIQSLMYKRPSPSLGVEVTIGQIGFASSKLSSSSSPWWGIQGAKDMPKNTFVLYSPGGQKLGTYNSIEKAQEASFDHKLGKAAAKVQTGIDVNVNPTGSKELYDRYRTTR